MARWIVTGTSMEIEADDEQAAIARAEQSSGWTWEAEQIPEPTYKIVRFYQSDDWDSEVIQRGLTLDEAKEHCNDPQTSSSTCTTDEGLIRLMTRGPWFDGWTEE